GRQMQFTSSHPFRLMSASPLDARYGSVPNLAFPPAVIVSQQRRSFNLDAAATAALPANVAEDLALPAGARITPELPGELNIGMRFNNVGAETEQAAGDGASTA